MKIWQSQDCYRKNSKHIIKSYKCLLESETVTKSSKLTCCNDFEEEKITNNLEFILLYSFGGLFLLHFWVFSFSLGTFWFGTLINILTIVIEVFYKKAAPKFFLQISQEFLFELSCRLNVCNFIKRRLWHRCFTVNFAKYFWTPFL